MYISYLSRWTKCACWFGNWICTSSIVFIISYMPNTLAIMSEFKYLTMAQMNSHRHGSVLEISSTNNIWQINSFSTYYVWRHCYIFFDFVLHFRSQFCILFFINPFKYVSVNEIPRKLIALSEKPWEYVKSKYKFVCEYNIVNRN